MDTANPEAFGVTEQTVKVAQNYLSLTSCFTAEQIVVLQNTLFYLTHYPDPSPVETKTAEADQQEA